jgi:hypothetical protein
MAYLQALSGIARSGVTYTGWTKPAFVITVGGTTRTTDVLRDGWAITERLNSPSICTFTLDNVTPTLGSDVKIRYSAANDWLFGGTLLQADAEILSPSQIRWHCTATGYAWLLGQFTVNRTFTNVSINTILATLLADYASSDFSAGYCPYDDRVTIEFSRTTLPEAFSQLAGLVAASGAWWEVTADKRVNLCATYPDGSFSLGNSTQAHGLRVTKDLTQVRTRTRVVGVETTVTTAVEAGATSISVAEIGWFQPSTIGAASGEAMVGSNVLTYTGTTSPDNTTYGPGTITGVTGVSEGIAEGERIAVLYTYDDTIAQTALASTLGSPASGIVTHWITDNTLSLLACKARAQADVTQYGGTVTTVEFECGARTPRVGRLVAASVSTPITVSGNYTIQQMTTTPRGVIAGTTVDLNRSIAAGASQAQVNDILRRVN